ncbi:MAG: acyltransferase [Nitrosomonas sp.]|uniref:acyltransferase family protein n=1 Tax=Nitrosomonas sp. TaxID=42353 RepID=UPI001DFB3691|nr:acyltransferase [Nitrosomonas sp.]MBX9895794.1 acyltransferase [Nitrosomonas sp.]
MKDTKSNYYIPSLDGMRAVAAMLVFVSHAGWPHLIPGGFGVTIFFFLSGYLITTLLRREYESTGSISFKNFFLRRAYRIFPPLYIVLGS